MDAVAADAVGTNRDAVVDGMEPGPAEAGRDAVATDAARDSAAAADAGHSAADASSPLDAAADAAPDGPTLRSPTAGDLAIVEILANPNGSDLGREWIEVLSLASEPLSLVDLHLSDGTTDAPAPVPSVGPGARILLGQSSDPSKNGGLSVTAAYGTRLILNNDDEQISICVGPCATGVVIDRVTWGTLGTVYDGHAIVVDPATKSMCPAAEPYGTAGDFGTPGEPNPPCAAADGGDSGPTAVSDGGSGG